MCDLDLFDIQMRLASEEEKEELLNRLWNRKIVVVAILSFFAFAFLFVLIVGLLVMFLRA